MFRKASRILALIVFLFSTMLITAPTVAAHSADGGGACYGSVKIIVFDNYDQLGADDDFCFYPYYSTAQDPNFDSNNAESDFVPGDDIGNRYLMGCCVSSYSVTNNWTDDICITFFANTNFTGWSQSFDYPPGHYHANIYNLFIKDNIRSMKVKMNPGYYDC